jgi:hypothetical protein
MKKGFSIGFGALIAFTVTLQSCQKETIAPSSADSQQTPVWKVDSLDQSGTITINPSNLFNGMGGQVIQQYLDSTNANPNPNDSLGGN